MTREEKQAMVPVWEKTVLTLEEASAYSGLGRHTLIEFSEDPTLNIVIWSGRKRLFKRRLLDEHIEKLYSV